MADTVYIKSPYAKIIDAQDVPSLPGSDPVKATALPTIKASGDDDEEDTPAASTAAPAPAPAASPTSLLPPPEQRAMFEGVAAHFKVPVNVLMALSQQESSYDPEAVNKSSGASGAAGYMADTAKSLRINPKDPNEAIPAMAQQLRERLDKGYSMDDAVKEHFAGPNRKLWGAKTAAYGTEVLAKAGAIGQQLYGDAPADDTTDAPAPAPPTAGPEQNQFSPTRMGKADYEKEFRALNPKASDAAVKAVMAQYDTQVAAKVQAGGNKVQDKFKQLQSPEDTFNARLNERLQDPQGGVVPNLPGKMQPDQFQNVSTVHDPSTFDTVAGNAIGGMANTYYGAKAAGASLLGDDIDAMSADAERQKISAKQKEMGGDTILGKASNLVGGVLPAMIVPEAKVAQVIANAGLFALPAFRDTYHAKIAEGYSQNLALVHAAEAFGINMVLPTVASKGAGAVIKGLGQAEAAGVRGASVGLAQAAGEGAGFSAINSVADKGTDVLAGQKNDHPWIDPQDMAVQALGFGALRAGHMAAHAASTAMGGAPAETSGPLTAAVESAAPDPAAQAAHVESVLSTLPAGASVVDQLRAIRPMEPAGPLEAAVQDAAAQHAVDPEPVPQMPINPAEEVQKLSDPDAIAAVDAHLKSPEWSQHREAMDADLKASTLAYEKGIADQRVPEKERAEAARQLLTHGIPVEPMLPLKPDYTAMTQDQLRTELANVAARPQTTKDERLAVRADRKIIEQEIGVRAKDAQANSKPAEEPLKAGPFEDMGAANKMMLRYAEQTGTPHEVVGSEGKFRVQPLKEQGNGIDTAGATGGSDGRGRSSGPADIVGSPDGTGSGAAGRGVDGVGRDRQPAPVAERGADLGADRTGADGTANVQPALKGESNAVSKAGKTDATGAAGEADAQPRAAIPAAKPSADGAVSPVDAAPAEPALIKQAAEKVPEVAPAEPDAKPKKPKKELPLSIGKMPNSAELITVKDGVVHIGDYPAQDYDTGHDITVPQDASPQQIKDALAKGNAIGKGNKIFGMPKSEEVAHSVAAHPMAADAIHEVDPLVSKLADSGTIVLHEDASTLPGGKAPDGVQALTTPDGKIHVVGNALGDNAKGVILHEAFHSGAKKLVGSEAWDGLQDRLGSLYRQGESTSGAARKFWDAARERVEVAKAKGAVTDGMEHEEFGAYAIEEYAKAPLTVRKWVDDLTGTVKAWELRRFGKQLGDVTPAQLSALAKTALLDVAHGRTSQAESDAHAYSVAATPEEPTVPESYRDKLARFLSRPKAQLHSAAHNIAMGVIPMRAGSEEAQAVAKQFANDNRAAQSQWNAFDTVLKKNYTQEQLEAMWHAADQENDLRREGQTSTTKGLASLPPDQRETVELLHAYGEQLWDRAKKAGLVDEDSEGVHFWTPRVAANIYADGSVDSISSKPGEFSKDAKNLRTSASSTKHRKYETTAESEAALKTKMGDDAAYVKNIRVMPMAMAQLEKAVAGRTLVNQIKAHGKVAGEDLISETGGPNFVTFDHPALKQWRPVTDWQPADKAKLAARGHEVRVDGVYKDDGTKLKTYRVKDGEAQQLRPLLDSEGSPILQPAPLFVHKDWAGPLKAVFSKEQGKVYRALMELKGMSMSMIMISPATHNAVIWGKAMPSLLTSMGAKNNLKNLGTAGLYTYFTGHKVRQDRGLMNELIKGGLVPVGGRGMNTDVAAIQDGVKPGRSFVAKAFGKVVDLASPKAGDAVRKGVDAAGHFWHETLLWDRIGDMQAGMAAQMRTHFMDGGIDQYTATRMATHFANRYAGAVPQEAISQSAHAFANMMLFSKSFTMTNLGAMKDPLVGLPSDVRAQIKQHAVEMNKALGKTDFEAVDAAGKVLKQAQGVARRKAATILMADFGAMAVVSSLTQAYFKSQSGSQFVDDLKERMHKLGAKLDADNPLSFMGPTMGKVGLPLAFMRHPFNNLDSLSQTHDNPHGKQDRIRIGEDEHGNSYYMRLPVGKVVEELKQDTNLSSLTNLMNNKSSPLVKGVVESWQNKDFYGRSVYDKNANPISQIGQVGGHILKSQVPFDDFVALKNLMSGEKNTGDKVHLMGMDMNMDQTKLLGTATGLSVSKLTGGDAAAELRYQNAEQRTKLNDVLPDAKDAIHRGDPEKALKILTDAGVSGSDLTHTMRMLMSPNAITARKMSQFVQHASPEEIERVQKMIQKK